MHRNSPEAARDGGPVVLRPARATPCFLFVVLFVVEPGIRRLFKRTQTISYRIVWQAYNCPTWE